MDNQNIDRKFEAKRVYFVMQTERDKDGWIPCIAVENESGYYRTDWHWDCTFEQAEKICDEKNTTLGFTPTEAYHIVLTTMRKK